MLSQGCETRATFRTVEDRVKQARDMTHEITARLRALDASLFGASPDRATTGQNAKSGGDLMSRMNDRLMAIADEQRATMAIIERMEAMFGVGPIQQATEEPLVWRGAAVGPAVGDLRYSGEDRNF